MLYLQIITEVILYPHNNIVRVYSFASAVCHLQITIVTTLFLHF
jgi:hypothetical protein